MVKIDKKIFYDVTKIVGSCDVAISDEDNVYIEDEYIESLLEDLVAEHHVLEEKLEDEVEQREEFYKPLSPYEYLGISERDFV